MEILQLDILIQRKVHARVIPFRHTCLYLLQKSSLNQSKNNADIRGITIFNHVFLYAAFADYSTFFLNDLLSVKNLIYIFIVFSLFSGLKGNFSKCEIAGLGLGSLKGVLEAACSLKSINLTTNTIKILGVHFSYNSTLKVQNNFLDSVKLYNKCFDFGTEECSCQKEG